MKREAGFNAPHPSRPLFWRVKLLKRIFSIALLPCAR